MITERKNWLVWATFPNRSQLVWKWNWVYLQSADKKWIPLYLRRSFHSKVLDLSCSRDQIYQGMSAAGQYEIRRARKDKLTIHYHTDVGVIIKLFSPTAEAKQLNPIGLSTFHTKKDYLVSEIRSPQYGAVAAHFYQLDKQSRRVHLTYNCSAYRLYQNKSIRSLCGRANRQLFLEDMYYFKDRGYKVFDYGGYAKGADQQQESVNAFKDTLPGHIVRQYNYFPLWYWIIRSLRGLLQKGRNG